MNNLLNEKQINSLKQWALDYDGIDKDKIPHKHIEELFQENGNIYIKGEEVEYSNITEYLNSYDGHEFEDSAAIKEAKIIITHMFDPNQKELLLKNRLETIQQETERLSSEEYEGDRAYEDFHAAINKSVINQVHNGQLKIALNFEMDGLQLHKEWETYKDFIEDMTKWYDNGQVEKMTYENTCDYNHNEDIELLDELMKTSYFPNDGIEAESKNIFLNLEEKEGTTNLSVIHGDSGIELANYHISNNGKNGFEVSSENKNSMSEEFNNKLLGNHFNEFLTKFHNINQENQLEGKGKKDIKKPEGSKRKEKLMEQLKIQELER